MTLTCCALTSPPTVRLSRLPSHTVEASHNHFGPLGVVFLTTYLQAYISAKDDRAQRVRILQSILRNAQAENDLDSSW